MNLKILSSLFFTLVIVSCAKPNWKNTEDNPTSPQAQLPQKPTDSESTTITECKYPLISQNMCVYLTWKVMPSSDSYGEFELYLKPIKSNTATSETENLNLTNK
ncbi:MAG: hypothetical protein KDD45_09820, partial [Bdellovibrionales bacterium]|nr:hypothetical protein [Bdellovibrionales bacterium]